jgi:hypothetical protein
MKGYYAPGAAGRIENTLRRLDSPEPQPATHSLNQNSPSNRNGLRLRQRGPVMPSRAPSGAGRHVVEARAMHEPKTKQKTAALMVRLPASTAELLADVALARSVTHQGDTTLSDIIVELVERWRLELEKEAQIVRAKREKAAAQASPPPAAK